MQRMSQHLNGKRVAIIATDGFEQSELEEPKAALEQAGAKTHVISLKAGTIRGWKEQDWGSEVAVDYTLNKSTLLIMMGCCCLVA